jgi:Fur family ferric uptake transcriptional regulator
LRDNVTARHRAGHPACLNPVDDAGYLVGEADVTCWGLCPQHRPEAG